MQHYFHGDDFHHNQRAADSDAEGLREELDLLTASGRLLAMLDRPFAECLSRLQLADELRIWAAIDWFGPLELWRAPGHEVSDMLFNGPPHDPFFIIQRGVMTNTGVTCHPSWIAWTQRQLLLRSNRLRWWEHADGRVTWPSLAVQGVADRLRYAVTAEPHSRDGGSIAVRTLPERWRTLDDLIISGVINREATELLMEALRCGASVLVGGATGSGKTTLTAGLTQELGHTQRLVFIEDGGELPRCINSLHIEVMSGGNEFSRAVSFALRQKPNYIIVGEVRGGEAMALLQAAATGHPGVGTIHASHVQAALRNLERMAMIGLASESGGAGQSAAQIVRGMITSDSVNLIVVHIGRTAQGRRAVLAIEEVLRQGAQGQSGDHFPTNVLFRHDTYSDSLQRIGYVQAEWGHGRM
ncbi:CpaF family protein [Candidatus Gracilibacteria bacterium]|nr:CpaF family protein [Candidatus Gracilibacteria bacterium]